MNNPIAYLLFLLAGLTPLGAADQKIEETARRLFKSHADAVVSVRATVALTMAAGDAPSQSRDQSVEEFGTVVSAKGLVMISASSIDPATAMDGRTVNMRGAQVKLAVTSEVKEARIILADGTEIPATVVYKDRDLNLAFLAPDAGAEESKDAKFLPIDTSEEQALGVLDEVVVLSRMDKSLGFAAAVECDYVRAVIVKPRRFLAIHLPTTGLPVFALGGRFAGFTTVRFGSAGEAEGIAASPAVLPAADVRKAIAAAVAATVAKPAPAPKK
jgi:S1-C subfamily serine protease